MDLRDARTLSPEELYDRRKQAVKLHEKGMSRKDIAAIVGVHRNKAGEWIRLWEQGGLRALKVKPAGAPVGSGRTLTPEQETEIRKHLIDSTPDQLKMPFALWTRPAVALLIKEKLGIDMPIRSVGNYLQRWGFTPQKPIKQAYERNEKRVKTWVEEEYPKLAERAKIEGAEIHWGDETGICSQDQVGRGYAPKGKTPVRKHRGSRERVNMISTVTNQGKVRFMFFQGSMDAERFISFLKRLIKGSERKVFLVLDNLRVHHAKLVKEWVETVSDKLELHYLPSYSPDLNPDEYLNCDLKAELAKRPSERVKGKLEKNARSHMIRLQKSPTRIRSYFKASPIAYAA